VSAPRGADGGAARVLRQRKAELLACLQAGGEVPLVRVGREVPLPLSFAQERMWILQQMDPDPNPHRLQFVFVIKATTCRALRGRGTRCWSARDPAHDVPDGRQRVLMQTVHAPQRVELPVVDLSGVPADGLGKEMRDRRSRCTASLRSGQRPVWRCWCTGCATACSAWRCVSITLPPTAGPERHHPELKELCAAYAEGVRRSWRAAGAVCRLRGVAAAVAAGGALARELSYWRERLAGMPPALELPTDLRGRRFRPSTVPAAVWSCRR